IDQRPRQFPVDRGLGQAADEVSHLVCSHVNDLAEGRTVPHGRTSVEPQISTTRRGVSIPTGISAKPIGTWCWPPRLPTATTAAPGRRQAIERVCTRSIRMVGRDGIGGSPPCHATSRVAARRFIAGGTLIVPVGVPP